MLRAPSCSGPRPSNKLICCLQQLNFTAISAYFAQKNRAADDSAPLQLVAERCISSTEAKQRLQGWNCMGWAALRMTTTTTLMRRTRTTRSTTTATTAGLPLANQLLPFGCARHVGPSVLLDAPCASRCSICSDGRSSWGHLRQAGRHGCAQ